MTTTSVYAGINVFVWFHCASGCVHVYIDTYNTFCCTCTDVCSDSCLPPCLFLFVGRGVEHGSDIDFLSHRWDL